MNAGSHPSHARTSAATTPFLAADIGGTHARVALMCVSPDQPHGLQLIAFRKFVCADFAGPIELLQTLLRENASTAVRHAVLACAGQVRGQEVLHDNLAWPIHLSQLKQALALDDVAVLNDFEALAYALDQAPAGNRRLLRGDDAQLTGPTLVIGPGTGLGAALRLPDQAGGHVLTTEAGQMDFAPHSVRERDILALLLPQGGYLPYEHIVSGPGLLVLYESLCNLCGETPIHATPEAVTAAAAAGYDAQAVEAVEIFCAALGSFVGSLAMAFMTTGGVYLAGGFLSSMFTLLKRSAFEERFLHGRSVRALLSRVPVWVTEHGQQGVFGAAQWYLRRGVLSEASPSETVAVSTA
jgi:glucokinase